MTLFPCPEGVTVSGGLCTGTFKVFVPLVLGLDPGRLLRVRKRRRVPHHRHLLGGGVGVVEHLDKVAGEDAALAVDRAPPPTVLDLAQELDDVLDLYRFTKTFFKYLISVVLNLSTYWVENVLDTHFIGLKL